MTSSAQASTVYRPLEELKRPGFDLFLPTHDCDIDIDIDIDDGRFVGQDGNVLIITVPTGSTGEPRDISHAYNNTSNSTG